MLSRRSFLLGTASGAALAALGCAGGGATTGVSDPSVRGRQSVRGAIVTVPDLTLDWPARAVRAGLTTLSLHSSAPSKDLVPFVTSDRGKAFLDECGELGLDVEYEIHAVGELLPRTLYASKPELFRTDVRCGRNPDGNLCVHTPEALDIAAENAIALCQVLQSTTGRYFLWGDDGVPWCECPECAPFAPSDQALLLENHLIGALRSVLPGARLAHLAYAGTLPAPTEVVPAPGVFLEFAPFYRRYDIPFDTPSDPTQNANLDALDANLAVFGAAGAQALEYWLDDSRASGWRRPPKRLPFDYEMVVSDVGLYRSRGVEDITTFAVYLDAEYVSLYGDPPIDAYGWAL